MDHQALLTQVVEASVAIRRARSASAKESPTDLDKMGLLRTFRAAWNAAPLGTATRRFVESLAALAGAADEILLYLRGRERFVHQQIALESRLVHLDETRLNRIAEALAAGRSLFQPMPEFRDPSLLSTLQDITRRLQDFDTIGEGKILAFNTHLRELRQWCLNKGLQMYEPVRCLPNELRL